MGKYGELITCASRQQVEVSALFLFSLIFFQFMIVHADKLILVAWYQFSLHGHLVGEVVRPLGLQSVTPNSSANGLYCFENLKEFDYFWRKVKYFEKS